MEPLVTIAIPFYNNADTIIDAVKSVFAQTYKNWELLLIDDGSTDGSLELVSTIDDQRVRIISDGENRGLIMRLNQIPSLSRGEFLARMDGDDFMDPSRIQKQVQFLLANTGFDLVDTGAYALSEKAFPVGIKGMEDINYQSEAIIKKAMLLHASILGRKEWFLENPYDEAYTRAEDYELWCRTYSFSLFGRIKEPLYLVREGKVNIENYRKSLLTVRKILKVYGGRMINSPNTLRIEILKTYLKIALYSLLGYFDRQDILSKRRSQPLSRDQLNDVQKILSTIRGTIVPGLELC